MAGNEMDLVSEKVENSQHDILPVVKIEDDDYDQEKKSEGGENIKTVENKPQYRKLYTVADLRRLNRERMTKKNCDLLLMVGDQAFCVHKYVIFAFCPTLRNLKQGEYHEGVKMSIIEDIDFVTTDTFSLILDMIYAGSTHFPYNQLLEVCSASKLLQFSEMQDKCNEYRYLAQQTGVCQTLEVYMHLADQVRIEKLRKAEDLTENPIKLEIKNETSVDDKTLPLIVVPDDEAKDSCIDPEPLSNNVEVDVGKDISDLNSNHTSPSSPQEVDSSSSNSNPIVVSTLQDIVATSKTLTIIKDGPSKKTEGQAAEDDVLVIDCPEQEVDVILIDEENEKLDLNTLTTTLISSSDSSDQIFPSTDIKQEVNETKSDEPEPSNGNKNQFTSVKVKVEGDENGESIEREIKKEPPDKGYEVVWSFDVDKLKQEPRSPVRTPILITEEPSAEVKQEPLELCEKTGFLYNKIDSEGNLIAPPGVNDEIQLNDKKHHEMEELKKIQQKEQAVQTPTAVEEEEKSGSLSTPTDQTRPVQTSVKNENIVENFPGKKVKIVSVPPDISQRDLIKSLLTMGKEIGAKIKIFATSPLPDKQDSSDEDTQSDNVSTSQSRSAESQEVNTSSSMTETTVTVPKVNKPKVSTHLELNPPYLGRDCVNKMYQYSKPQYHFEIKEGDDEPKIGIPQVAYGQPPPVAYSQPPVAYDQPPRPPPSPPTPPLSIIPISSTNQGRQGLGLCFVRAVSVPSSRGIRKKKRKNTFKQYDEKSNVADQFSTLRRHLSASERNTVRNSGTSPMYVSSGGHTVVESTQLSSTATAISSTIESDQRLNTSEESRDSSNESNQPSNTYLSTSSGYYKQSNSSHYVKSGGLSSRGTEPQLNTVLVVPSSTGPNQLLVPSSLCSTSLAQPIVHSNQVLMPRSSCGPSMTGLTLNPNQLWFPVSLCQTHVVSSVIESQEQSNTSVSMVAPLISETPQPHSNSTTDLHDLTSISSSLTGFHQLHTTAPPMYVTSSVSSTNTHTSASSINSQSTAEASPSVMNDSVENKTLDAHDTEVKLEFVSDGDSFPHSSNAKDELQVDGDPKENLPVSASQSEPCSSLGTDAASVPSEEQGSLCDFEFVEIKQEFETVDDVVSAGEDYIVTENNDDKNKSVNISSRLSGNETSSDSSQDSAKKDDEPTVTSFSHQLQNMVAVSDSSRGSKADSVYLVPVYRQDDHDRTQPPKLYFQIPTASDGSPITEIKSVGSTDSSVPSQETPHSTESDSSEQTTTSVSSAYPVMLVNNMNAGQRLTCPAVPTVVSTPRMTIPQTVRLQNSTILPVATQERRPLNPNSYSSTPVAPRNLPSPMILSHEKQKELNLHYYEPQNIVYVKPSKPVLFPGLTKPSYNDRPIPVPAEALADEKNDSFAFVDDSSSDGTKKTSKVDNFTDPPLILTTASSTDASGNTRQTVRCGRRKRKAADFEVEPVMVLSNTESPDGTNNVQTIISTKKRSLKSNTEGLYSCEKCINSKRTNGMFHTTLKDLLKHYEMCHNGSTIYNCKICDFGYTEYGFYVRHLRCRHKDVYSPHICEVCGDIFKSSDDRLRHIDEAHKVPRKSPRKK